MEKNKIYEGIERRKSSRLKYINLNKPRLKIGKFKLKVNDISQRGLKFLKDEETYLPENIKGNLTFLCGESLEIGGTLIWEQDDNFALYLKTLIPSDMIQKEELYIQGQLSSK